MFETHEERIGSGHHRRRSSLLGKRLHKEPLFKPTSNVPESHKQLKEMLSRPPKRKVVKTEQEAEVLSVSSLADTDKDQKEEMKNRAIREVESELKKENKKRPKLPTFGPNEI